jgi:enoyl-CoA hydratase/carnithine racemase
MTYQTIFVDRINEAVMMTVNRRDKKNAMSPKLCEAMADALEQLRCDGDARVVIITGAGGTFCAGMDLQQFFADLKDDTKEYGRIPGHGLRVSSCHVSARASHEVSLESVHRA